MWTPKPAIELSSQRAVRRHNLSIVLRQVVERGPRSRATIAQDTGLNKSTVSSLVSELMEFGLLVERGAEHRGTAGRPGLVVDVARDGVIALGLEVNVDYLGVQATDLAGGSRYKAMEAVDNRGRGVGEVFEALGALTQGALNEVQAQGLRPIGATIALPGLVDIQRGALLVAPNLHWVDVPVVELLREHIDATALPISADNEANLAALAELWEGAATGYSDFVYVSGEIGVGGGIVLGGELFRGYRGLRRRVRPHHRRGRRAPVRVRLARLPGDARGPRAPAGRGRTRTARRSRPAARASRSPSCAGAPRTAIPPPWPRWPSAAAGWASRSAPS